MLNYDNFAITLGRAIDVFRTSPDAVVQQKGALRALVALASLGATALRTEDGVLLVGGRAIPSTLPFVSGLVERMETHGVRRLNISRGASAFDLLSIVKGLAADTSGAFENSTARFKSVGVDRIEIAPERLGGDHRPASVTTAFDRDQILQEAGELDPPDEVQRESVPVLEVDGDADDGTAAAAVAMPVSDDAPPPSMARLEVAMLRLAAASEGDDVESLIAAVTEGVEGLLDAGSDDGALAGIACLVNLESQVPTAVAPLYTQGLQRLLVPETLVRMARLVAQSRHSRYAVAVLHRAGTAGTTALLEQLVKAPSVEEKDFYGAALVAVPGGVDGLVAGLDSGDPTVVRAALDQVCRLNVPNAPTLIGRLAASHAEAAVRQAACESLCRMPFTDEVGVEIERLLTGGAARLVARCVGPGAHAGLVELIVAASEDDTDLVAKKALSRALGRVGSPRATRQLIKSSLAGGRFFGRKPVEARLAAIEGLGLVAGPAAQGTVEELLHDRNQAIREAARAIIEARDSRG